MSLILPPSTRKKKARARRVFGDAVVAGDEAESSLSYSPSPGRHSETLHAPLQRDSNASPVKSHTSSQLEYSSSTSSSCSSSDDTRSSTASSTRGSGPFDKIIATDKENTSSSPATGSSYLPESNKVVALSASHVRDAQEQLRRLRMQNRSPLRRDWVKQTQDAINSASISVNQSLRAAQRAKDKSLRQKTSQSARFREERKNETAVGRSFHRQAEQNRREMLRLQRQLSFKYSKEKANRRLNRRQQQLHTVEEESQFKSAVFRDQQQLLKQEQERRRRLSTAARAKQRQNHRLGTQKLQLQRIKEDQAIWDDRADASVAARTTKAQQAQQRRKSFAFRNGDARRIRALHAQLQADQMAQESSRLHDKWNGERDAVAYQRRLEKERRESLAARNAAAQQQRNQEAERHSREQEEEHRSIELKWAGQRDAADYQKQLREQRRQSLADRNQRALATRQANLEVHSQAAVAESESYAFKWDGERDALDYLRSEAARRRASLEQRNAHARQQREQSAQEQEVALQQQHEDYHLKWAGEKDAEEYWQEIERVRRESLAFRNAEGKRQRQLEEQQQAEEQIESHASYALKWEGENDAKAYEMRMESERRESLSFRNQEGRRQRRLQEESNAATLLSDHDSFELKWAGEKDAEAYQEQLAREKRESLAFRNKERLRHCQVMEELRTIAHEKETESLVLKWAGENDSKAYLAKVEEQRRLSLQQRGKQLRQGRDVESQQKAEELMASHKDEELRSTNHKHVENYRKQCAARDRASLEYRRKEARVQRIQEQERHVVQEEIESKNFALETQAQRDVEEYLKECRRRRRLSLAFRAKEKRRHGEWRREQAERELQEQSRQVRHRLEDQRTADLARQNERARIVVNAVRHNDYSLF